MEIGDRITELMTDKGLNYRSFADLLGYSDMAVRNICMGKSKPRFDFLEEIIKHYPNLSSHWLLTGKGSKTSTDQTFIKGEVTEEGIRRASVFVVSNQDAMLKDQLFNEFVEKMALRKMLKMLQDNK